MNSEWKNFNVWASAKVAETDKACLFEMPIASEMKGMKFWYNKKLVKETKSPKLLRLGYTPDMEFKVFKQEKVDGKYKTVEEKTLKGADLEKAFAACNKPLEKKAPVKEEPKQEVEITDEDLPFVADDQELDF